MKPIYLMIATLAAVLAIVANSAQFMKECDGRSMRECVAELIDWTTGRPPAVADPVPVPDVNDNAAQAGSSVETGTNWDSAPADGNVTGADGNNWEEAPASDTGVQSGGNNWDAAPPNDGPQN